MAPPPTPIPFLTNISHPPIIAILQKSHPPFMKGAQPMQHDNHKTSTTAVLAGNDTFLTKNITQDRKRSITQPKHMIF